MSEKPQVYSDEEAKELSRDCWCEPDVERVSTNYACDDPYPHDQRLDRLERLFLLHNKTGPDATAQPELYDEYMRLLRSLVDSRPHDQYPWWGDSQPDVSGV